MDNDNKNIIIEPQKAIVTNQFPKKNNGSSITSLVFGIISLILCWVFICSIITGIIGIIAGIVSFVKKRSDLNLAIAGIITSLLGLFLCVIFSAITIVSMIM